MIFAYWLLAQNSSLIPYLWNQHIWWNLYIKLLIFSQHYFSYFVSFSIFVSLFLKIYDVFWRNLTSFTFSLGKVKLVKLRVVLELEAADCLTGTFELLLQAVDAGTSLFLDSLFLDSLLIGVEAGWAAYVGNWGLGLKWLHD